MENCCKNCAYKAKIDWNVEYLNNSYFPFVECSKIANIGIYSCTDFSTDYDPKNYDIVSFNGNGPDESNILVRKDFCCKYFKPKK